MGYRALTCRPANIVLTALAIAGLLIITVNVGQITGQSGITDEHNQEPTPKDSSIHHQIAPSPPIVAAVAAPAKAVTPAPSGAALEALALIRVSEAAIASMPEHAVRKADELRRQANESSGLYLGKGNISELVMETGNINAAQLLTHRQMRNITYRCNKMERFGNEGDGGYEICQDPNLEPKKDDCLVYSFGINRDFSFDDAVNDKYGCEVHSFDPSMGQSDHIHREPNMYFHNLGLWDSDWVNEDQWKLKSIGSIVKLLKHEQRIIDVLKIDVEGPEWSILVDLLKSGVFLQVKQLMLEVHTPRVRTSDHKAMTLIDYAEAYDIIATLERAGFARFLSYNRNVCCGGSVLTFVDRDIAIPRLVSDLCCYEQFFINTKL